MSIKVELLVWSVKTFGENDPDDLINIREEIISTKDPRRFLRKIVLFVKKRIGINKDWLVKEVTDRWQTELKKIVGEHLKFDMKSIEGREIKYLSGMENIGKKQHFVEKPGIDVYNYQFNFELIKNVSIKEKSNVGIKPRVSKVK